MKSTRLLGCMLLILLMSGCAKKAMLRKYYVLEPPASVLTEQKKFGEPLAFRVECKPFRVARAFSDSRIVVRSSSHELNYYYYHLWAVRPPNAVSDLVFSTITHSGLFNHCTQKMLVKPDFYITGEIEQIERYKEGKQEYARLSGSIKFFDASDDHEIVLHSFKRQTNITKNNSMNHFAQVISQMLYEETLLFIDQLAGHFDKAESATE